METNSPRSVFGYTDYRVFLSEYIERKRVVVPSFSLRGFSRGLGLKAENFLSLIVAGKRNLSPKLGQKLAAYLELNQRERAYFLKLVEFNQSTASQEKLAHLRELLKLSPRHELENLRPSHYRFLSHWFYPVLRELISIGENRRDPKRLARLMRFRISSPEVEDALKDLIDLGFVRERGDGSLQAGRAIIRTSDEIQNVTTRNFQKEMFGLAVTALDEIPVEERECSTLTIALDSAGLELAKAKLKSFRRKLHEQLLDRASTPEAVFQLNIQLFPLTHSTSKLSKE